MVNWFRWTSFPPSRSASTFAGTGDPAPMAGTGTRSETTIILRFCRPVCPVDSPPSDPEFGSIPTMLTVEPVIDSPHGLHVGEYAHVEWRTDLDVPASEIEIEVGADVVKVGPVEKTDAGAGEWTYSVRILVGSIRTRVQLEVPGQRVENTAFSANRALTG